MNIEVKIFSGLPNPTWRLSEQESLEFIGMLKKINKSNVEELPEQLPRGDLGYQGFLVMREQHDPGRFREVWVKGNFVLLQKDIRKGVYLDVNRRLERWLLASGKTRIDTDLWEHIKSEMEKDN